METETKPAPKLAAIRTFAKDLDTERNHKTTTPSTQDAPVVSEEPVQEEPVRASDTLTTEVTRVVAPVPAAKPKPEPKKPIAVPSLKPITPTRKEPTIIVDNEDAAAATIITDTKRGEFKLIPAILNSIRSWFSDKKQTYAAKKVPKYTVPDTTRRKGIIQKATSKSGKFAAADFSSIQERILERKAAATKAKESSPEPESDSNTIWTANTEPGFPLLTETIPEPISNVHVVPRKSFRATPEEIIVIKTAPVEPQVATLVPEPEEPADNRWSIETHSPAAEVATVPPAQEEKILTGVSEPEPEEVVTLEVVSEPEPAPIETSVPPKGRFDVLKINTNTLTMYVSGAVIALAVLGTTGYFMLYTEGVPGTSPAAKSQSLLVSTEVRSLMLYTVTASSIIEAFNTLQNERGTTEAVFLYTSTIGSAETVSPSLLVSVLDLKLVPDFAQTISAIRVGYINQAPYLLIKINDTAAAKGGLLLWEPEMYDSLMPLLLLTPEGPTAFLDATISGTDVRVLKNSNGAVRLLYGIVDGTILITTNSASYAQLTTVLK